MRTWFIIFTLSEREKAVAEVEGRGGRSGCGGRRQLPLFKLAYSGRAKCFVCAFACAVACAGAGAGASASAWL